MISNTKQRKTEQLKMNPSSANAILIRDILFSFVVKLGLNECHQCHEAMTRKTFSIEHKTPWLDSENPIELFFDLDNISFSHHVCNVKAARRKARVPKHGTANEYDYKGCRCELCTTAKREAVYRWRNKVGHR